MNRKCIPNHSFVLASFQFFQWRYLKEGLPREITGKPSLLVLPLAQNSKICRTRMFAPNLKFMVCIGMVIAMVRMIVKAIKKHLNMAILTLTNSNWDVDAIFVESYWKYCKCIRECIFLYWISRSIALAHESVEENHDKYLFFNRSSSL